jgi:hypothetical protein
VEKATRKDPKSNNNIAKKAKKYLMNTTPSSTVDFVLLSKIDTSI